MTTTDDVALDQSHVVYRMFDASDQLLYIGVTGDPGKRFTAHRRNAPWWLEVVKITLQRFERRDDADLAEARAILAEAPLYNRVGRRPDAVPDQDDEVPPYVPVGPMRMTQVRIPDDLWEDFGKLVGEGYRSQAIREYIYWSLHLPGAKRPVRPPKPEQPQPVD